MPTNTLPFYDQSENTTGCCPRFKPETWDRQDLHFEDKLFVRATTRNVMHIPMNMGSVFKHTFESIEKAGAMDPDNFAVLSRDLSPWKGEHLFAVYRCRPHVYVLHDLPEMREGLWRKLCRRLREGRA